MTCIHMKTYTSHANADLINTNLLIYSRTNGTRDRGTTDKLILNILSKYTEIRLY